MKRLQKPIDEARNYAKKYCPFCQNQGGPCHYFCSLIGNKLEGAKVDFYYSFHGEEPCSNEDTTICPILSALHRLSPR